MKIRLYAILTTRILITMCFFLMVIQNSGLDINKKILAFLGELAKKVYVT